MALGNFFMWPLSSHVKILYSLFPLRFFSVFNVLQRKYQEEFENLKDQIYFMQTETGITEADDSEGERAESALGGSSRLVRTSGMR